MKKTTVLVGNPMIAKSGDDNYFVVYANPSENWKITEYNNLTRDEVFRLPFVDKKALVFLA